MKIALIGRYEEGEIVAGPERVARELFSELRRKNFQVVFIEYFFSGYKNSSVYKKIFGKEFLNGHSIVRLGILPLLLFIIKEKFKIIHIVNLQRFILFIFLIKPFIKSNFIATLHGFSKYEIPKRNYWTKRYCIDLWVEKLIVKTCRLLIFPSKLLYEIFNNHYIITDGKYRIIPNGVSEIFNRQPINFPPIKNSIKLVFYNGFNKSLNKEPVELLLLLNEVKINIELYIVGEKFEFNTNKKIELNFVGLKAPKELIDFLSDKHFVIKSKAIDTFSIFIAECMCLGLIPIINENVGIRDFIKENENGFIYDSRSPSNLSNLLNEIYNDKYNLNLISAGARRIYDILNWERITEQYIAIYNSVV